MFFKSSEIAYNLLSYMHVCVCVYIYNFYDKGGLRWNDTWSRQTWDLQLKKSLPDETHCQAVARKMQPLSQIQHAHCFVNKVLLAGSHTCIACSCFHTTVVELSSHGVDYMAPKAFCPALHRKKKANSCTWDIFLSCHLQIGNIRRLQKIQRTIIPRYGLWPKYLN